MDQVITLNLTINLAYLRAHLTIFADQDLGLEDSAGRTPSTLDDGLDFLQGLLPDNLRKELMPFLHKIQDVVDEVHQENGGE